MKPIVGIFQSTDKDIFMKIVNKIKNLYKYLIRGNKATSITYERYLRKIGVKIGDGCVFHDPATTFIDNDKPYMIEIGNNVHITRNCTIVAHGYDWIVLKNYYNENYGSAGKIVIGNNVFLGMGTTVLKDVTIGNNVIIGAGSLVTEDIESECVAVGRPARKVMTLEEYREKRRNLCLQEAANSYREMCKKGILINIKDWEFSWIYDKKTKNHVFDNFEEFLSYIENESDRNEEP